MSYSLRRRAESRYFYRLKVLDLKWRDQIAEGDEGFLPVKNSLEGVLNTHLKRKKILSVDFLDSERIVLLMADQTLILSNNPNKDLRTKKIEFTGPQSINYILPHRGCYYFFSALRISENGVNSDGFWRNPHRSYYIGIEEFEGILRAVEDAEGSRINSGIELQHEDENRLVSGGLMQRRKNLQQRTQKMGGWIELEEQNDDNLRVGLMDR